MQECTEQPKLKISVTGLMDYCESAAHYKAFQIDKLREPSDAMLEGRALHAAVLEPEKFATEFYSEVNVPRGTKVLKTVEEIKAFLKSCDQPVKGKKEELEAQFKVFRNCAGLSEVMLYSEIESLYQDRTKITPRMMENVIAMRDSLLKHRLINKYINLEASKEELIEGEIDGVTIRGRLDWYFYSAELNEIVILDVKKCRSAKRRKWEQTIYDSFYFIQAWLYSELIRQKFNKDTLYIYACVEGGLPHIAECYAADDGQLDAGEQLARYKLAQWKKSMATNTWPGYSDGNVQPCGLPAYAFDQIAKIVEGGQHE